MAIYASDENFAAFGASHDPAVFAQWIKGDVLWAEKRVVPIDTVHVINVDVKAKRKLEDTSVLFVLTAQAQAVTSFVALRCLVATP